MKTIKIDKNSKVIKFLTARSDHQPLFGIFPWRPEPYREGSWSKPLPEDTCSLRKALISHVVKTGLALTVWTIFISFIVIMLLSALIITPYEVYAGILFKTNTFVGAAGFTTWLVTVLSLICFILNYVYWKTKDYLENMNEQEKQVDSVFSVLYSSIKNKLCSKIEYIEHVEHVENTRGEN